MKMEHAVNKGILVITPQEKSLNTADVPVFKEQVIELLKAHPQSQVVFDLHRLSFMDSSGIGSFLSFFRLLNSQGRQLSFACVNRPMQTIFQLVSINKLFPIFDSVDKAVSSYAEKG
jgi:anti-anti-sigma factor